MLPSPHIMLGTLLFMGRLMQHHSLGIMILPLHLNFDFCHHTWDSGIIKGCLPAETLYLSILLLTMTFIILLYPFAYQTHTIPRPPSSTFLSVSPSPWLDIFLSGIASGAPHILFCIDKFAYVLSTVHFYQILIFHPNHGSAVTCFSGFLT